MLDGSLSALCACKPSLGLLVSFAVHTMCSKRSIHGDAFGKRSVRHFNRDNSDFDKYNKIVI